MVTSAPSTLTDFITQTPQFGGWTLFFLQFMIFLRAFRKGKLYPASVVASMRKDYSARVSEARERERKAYETCDLMTKANASLMIQNKLLLDTLNKFGVPHDGEQPQ